MPKRRLEMHPEGPEAAGLEQARHLGRRVRELPQPDDEGVQVQRGLQARLGRRQARGAGQLAAEALEQRVQGTLEAQRLGWPQIVLELHVQQREQPRHGRTPHERGAQYLRQLFCGGGAPQAVERFPEFEEPGAQLRLGHREKKRLLGVEVPVEGRLAQPDALRHLRHGETAPGLALEEPPGLVEHSLTARGLVRGTARAPPLHSSHRARRCVRRFIPRA